MARPQQQTPMISCFLWEDVFGAPKGWHTNEGLQHNLPRTVRSPQITGTAGNVKDCGQFCLYNMATSVGSVPSGNRKLPYPLSRTNGHEFFSLEWYFSAPEKYIHFLYGPWGHLEAWAMIFDREKTWDQYLNLAWHMREKTERRLLFQLS